MALKTLGTRLQRLDLRTARPPVKEALPFYQSTAWKGLMKAIFAKRGRVCQDRQCDDPTARGPRYGDHIIELRDGGAPLDEGNVMVMCATCHGRKTERERKARAARQADIERAASIRLPPR